MKTPDNAALLTVRDVAQRLNVSAACVYALVERRRIPHVRIGSGRGVIRFRSDDVEQYLTAQRVERDDAPARPQRVRLKHIRLRK
jgi:excisionase family DNA binding protein